MLVLSHVGGEAARTLSERLKSGGCGQNTCPTLGSYEVDQGTGMCVFLELGGEAAVEGLDAHHMGSCGPRASVGG